MDLHGQNPQPKSANKLNFTFIQRVINVCFLLFMVGMLTSFFSKTDDGANANTAVVSTQPYLGEIAIYPYSFTPAGWARCEGQLLQIAQNTALFALIGTTYGGNGQTTFALPDLRGKVIISRGQGPGLPNYVLGQIGGNTNTTLSVSNLPPHNHSASGTIRASSADGEEADPTGKVPAKWSAVYNEDDNVSMKAGGVNVTVNNTGSGTQFTNMPPYQVLGYFIALTGQFPSQN